MGEPWDVRMARPDDHGAIIEVVDDWWGPACVDDFRGRQPLVRTVQTDVVSDFYCEQVLNGRRAVDVVHEDEHVLAYHHTRPCFSDAHVVVVPKAHVSSLLDPAAEPLLPDLLAVVCVVAAQVMAEHGAARVLTNLGSYQDSKHLHWRVYAGTDVAEPSERPSGPNSRRIDRT